MLAAEKGPSSHNKGRYSSLKKGPAMGTLLALLICLLALVLCVGNEVFAKSYTRGCSVRYSVTPTINGRSGNSATFTFEGKGTVGYYNPNEARRRARRNIDECIDTHWASRHSGVRPSQCSESNQIYNYPFSGQLEARIANEVCRRNRGHSSLNVTVTALYSGREGCTLRNNSWNRIIVRNHRVNCANMAYEPNTNRPGQDYARLNLGPRSTWSTCRSRCLDQERCRAWAFRRPGTRGDRNGHCWLKHGVPNPQPHSEFISGVKEEP